MLLSFPECIVQPLTKGTVSMRLVVQSCLTLCSHLDCSPPGSSVHGILQAIEEEFSRQLRRNSPGNGVGHHFLLQEIVPTQGSNLCLLCLLHCRQILYWLIWPHMSIVLRFWGSLFLMGLLFSLCSYLLSDNYYVVVIAAAAAVFRLYPLEGIQAVFSSITYSWKKNSLNFLYGKHAALQSLFFTETFLLLFNYACACHVFTVIKDLWSMLILSL